MHHNNICNLVVSDFTTRIFSANEWLITGDCNPRVPALSFAVKKEGANKGRIFYTCQKEKNLACGFFLWRDDAVARESAAVLANSRTEPSRTTSPVVKPEKKTGGENAQNATLIQPRTPATAGGRAARQMTPDSRRPLAPRAGERLELPDDTPSKSSRSFLTTSRGGDTTSFEMTSEDEQILFQADRVAETSANAGPVSRRVQFKPTTTVTTPGKRKFVEMDEAAGSLPTPDTGKRRITSATKSAGPSRTIEETSLNDLLDLVSPRTTPTPARFKEMTAEDSSLWTSISEILDDEGVSDNDAARPRIEEACRTHGRKHKGLIQA